MLADDLVVLCRQVGFGYPQLAWFSPKADAVNEDDTAFCCKFDEEVNLFKVIC